MQVELKDRFKKIYLVDSFSFGGHHEIYNAAMAIMLCRIFGSLTYYVGAGQRKSLESKFEVEGFAPSSIEWHELRISEAVGKKALLIRHVRSLLNNIRLLLGSKRDSLVIFNYNNPFALFWIKFFNIFKRQNIIIINHGELEYITTDSRIPYARSTRLVGRFMRFSLRFCRGSKRIHYIVLGESIKKNLEKENLIPSSQIVVLEHPYFFKQSAPKDRTKVKTVCIKNIIANFDTEQIIAQVAQQNPNLTFAINGAVCSIEGPNIVNHTSGYQIERSEFEKILQTFDCMMFLYPHYEYRLKASGAIFDAIQLGIPVFAIRNDYFADVFEKSGDLGILFDNMGQMTENIPINISSIDLELFEQNLNKAREHYSVSHIGNVLAQKLSTIFTA